MKYLILILCLIFTIISQAQSLYEMPANPQSRLSSFENPNSIKGNGGKTNKTAKGNAFENMEPGEFTNWYQGCTIANDSTGQFNFYRWHIPDAIYFNKDIKVTIQQIGGWMKEDMKRLNQRGVNFKAITVDGPTGFTRLLDMDKPPLLTDSAFPEGWVNFYRIDDYSSVSYFYLDKPASSLSSLPSLNVRLKGVK